MTDRIEYTFDLDGFVDEIRYYRSLTTIDVNNPPPPTAVLDGSDRTFVDNTVTAGQTYHVIFSSYRNGIEKFSDEITVTAEGFIVNLDFENGLIDKSGKIWAATGAAQVSSEDAASGSNSLKLSGGNISCADSPDFNFAGSDFSIKASVKLASFSGWGMLLAKRNSGANYAPVVIGVSKSGNGAYCAISATGTSWLIFETFNNVLTSGWNKIELSRSGEVVTFKVNDTTLLTRNIGSSILMSNSNPLTIGANANGGEFMSGFVDDVILK